MTHLWLILTYYDSSNIQNNTEQQNQEISKIENISNETGQVWWVTRWVIVSKNGVQAGWGGAGNGAKLNPEQKWASGEGGGWGHTKVNQTNFDWGGPDGGPGPKGTDGPPAPQQQSRQPQQAGWAQPDSGAGAGWRNGL